MYKQYLSIARYLKKTCLGLCGWLSHKRECVQYFDRVHFHRSANGFLFSRKSGGSGKTTYRIAGNFRVVQNFEFFADGSASAKIKNAKIAASAIFIATCVWAPRKLKPQKFLLEPSVAIPRNFAPAKISRYTV